MFRDENLEKKKKAGGRQEMPQRGLWALRNESDDGNE